MIAGLAAVFLVLAITSFSRTSATFDEPVYIVGGLARVTLGDFTMKDDAPPLVTYLAGLSPWLHGMRIPNGKLPFHDGLGREYHYAISLLYQPGMDSDRIIFWSRVILNAPLALLLLGASYLWARELFGPLPAFVTLVLLAFCPNLLAHAGIVSADLPCAATMTATGYLFWRLTERPSLGRALACGVALGLALITKFTALVLSPSLVLLSAWWIMRAAARRRSHLLLCCLLVLLSAGILVSVSYLTGDGLARYIAGVRAIYRNLDPHTATYLFGQFHPGRVPHYYLAAMAVKMTLPLLLLSVMGLFPLLRTLWRAAREGGFTHSVPSARIFGVACVTVPLLVLLLATSMDLRGFGIRRVLPALPLLAILAGYTASRWITSARGVIVTSLLLLHAGSSLLAWPYFLPYFNELARAVSAPDHLLDDSSIDIGQDLKALPDAMKRNGVAQVHLLYHGTADPTYYGIRHDRLRLRELYAARLAPGFYAISQHALIRLQQRGPHRLTDVEPIDRAGTSILLYEVK